MNNNGLPTPYATGENWTLYHGDCLAILPHLGKVDAVVTDPPYGVGLKGKKTKRAGSLANTGYSNLSDDPEVVTKIAVPAVKMCIERFGIAIVTPGVRNMWAYPSPSDVGCVFNPSGAGLGRWGFTCFHPILYYGKCPYLKNGMGHRPSGFKDIAAGEKIEGHPCPKPLRWMEWMVKKATAFEEKIILDPFTGSGTTGVACIKTGRRFIGIEIDEHYCEIAANRLRKAEADKASQLIGGAA